MTVIPTIPSGSGFGKKKQKRPREDKQNIFSNSKLQVLGVISEGPCEGVIGGAKGVRIDGVPVQNEDNTLNFSGVLLDFRNGTQFQPRIPGYGDEVASERSVGVEVLANLPPVTKTISNKSLDAVAVSIGFAMEEYPPDGGVLGSTLHFRVWIKEGNGAFVLRHEDILTGRYSSLTVADLYFPVNNQAGTVRSFQIRVERVTPQDVDTDRYRRTLKWQSFTEIIEAKIRYPWLEVVAMQVSADQSEADSEVSFVNGGRLIEIPNNSVVAVDRGLDYSGVWGGGFVEPTRAPTCPAWILYDLLSNPRYGMGRVIERDTLDRWSFYELSKFCNELIPDGRGGLERRFACNVYLDGSKEDSWRVVDSFRSIFRGFAYYQEGVVRIASSRPATPTLQFTQADVVDSVFNYTRPPLTDRYSVALVTWIDPTDEYQQAIETVEIPELVHEYGYRVMELTAFACTSQGQARRAGLAALLQPETVQFTARRYSSYCRPGDVIQIADNRRSESESGGLILDVPEVGATLTRITLDRGVSIAAGVTYSLSISLPTGGLESRPVQSAPGNQIELLVPNYSHPPQFGTNWILTSAIVEPQLFTVINVIPDPDSNYSLFEIFGVEFDPGRQNYIDYGWSLQQRQTRQAVPNVISPPIGLALQAVFFGTVPSLFVNWQAPTNPQGGRDPFITGYYVEIKRGLAGDWGETRTTSTPGLEIDGLVTETYTARVASIAIDGKSSQWIESSPIYLSGPNLWADFSRSESSVMLAVV